MPNRLKWAVLGAIGVLALVVVGLGVAFVTLRRPAAAPANQIAIEVSDKTCTPDAVRAAAGTPTFTIHNTSQQAIEWEILDGVMVVAERENIAPGFTVALTPRLDPGSYQMTCGLLSNPKGQLTVATADGSTAALPARPTLTDLVGPTAEYRVYAIKTVDALTSATQSMAAAVKSGDLAAARTQADGASATFARLAPILHLFPNDVAPLETGPAALASLGRSLAAGGSAGDLAAAADSAARSAANFGGAINSTTAAPHEIVAGAGTVVADLARGGVGDPADAAARIAGVRKIVDLFHPLTLRADKALADKIDADLSTVEAALAQPRPDSSALAPHLTDLGADMTDLLSALGLNTA